MSFAAAVRRKGDDVGDKYYVCPSCGFKQRSQAEKKIRCHRCDKQYKRRTAKTTTKEPDKEKGVDFFQYS
jgi:ribosomal protein L37AE/L43A